MLQLTADLSFFNKPLNDFRFILVRIQQHFDGQVTSQIRVATLQDGSHPTASDFALQAGPCLLLARSVHQASVRRVSKYIRFLPALAFTPAAEFFSRFEFSETHLTIQIAEKPCGARLMAWADEATIDSELV